MKTHSSLQFKLVQRKLRYVEGLGSSGPPWPGCSSVEATLEVHSSSPRGSGGSQPRAAGEDELQRPLQVPVGGLQHPQHQLLVLDAHVPELLDLGLPAALEPKPHSESSARYTSQDPKPTASLDLVTPPWTPNPTVSSLVLVTPPWTAQ